MIRKFQYQAVFTALGLNGDLRSVVTVNNCVPQKIIKYSLHFVGVTFQHYIVRSHKAADQALFLENRLKFIYKLFQQACQIDFAVLQRNGGQIIFCDFQKFVYQVLQSFRLGERNREILFPQLFGNLFFIPQQVDRKSVV